MNELDIEKERELLRKMMEHSLAEQERQQLEAARLKAEAEDAAWWQAKLDAQKVYEDNLCKEILEEDSYGKFKAEQERIREAMVDAHLRKSEERRQLRESTPGWGGFS